MLCGWAAGWGCQCVMGSCAISEVKCLISGESSVEFLKEKELSESLSLSLMCFFFLARQTFGVLGGPATHSAATQLAHLDRTTS